MRNKIAQYKLVSLLTLILGGAISLVAGQYFYFDTSGISGYPYQQGCNEQLNIKLTTENNITGAGAGLITLQLDPTYFSYATGNIDTMLFVASPLTYHYYLGLPIWKDIAQTMLYIDRNNGGSNYTGNNLYGTLSFIPKYNANEYTGNFYIVYNGSETVTSLSYNGNNIINAGHQNSRLTGAYYVYQRPCTNDTTPPATNVSSPTEGSTKQFSANGVHVNLLENVGAGSVPYIRTGGLPDIGTWTINSRGINNQYGVNLSTFEIRISGNGTGRYFTGGMFSPLGTLQAIANNTTWQFRDRDYTINISGSEIFDYGIEKPITISGSVYDWNGIKGTFIRHFNPTNGPTLIVGSRIPAAGSVGILGTPAVKLGIQDDWAGVDSGTIVVTLQGIAGTTYGPYMFSGNDLNLSGIQGSANLPDYYITISGQATFPSSGIIQVNIYAEDMEGNIDTISDYSFQTKPSCTDYGCCNNVYLQTGSNPPFYYSGFILYVSGGINPYFTGYGNTGTIYCGTENEEPMDIYRGTEDQSGTATFLSIHDLPNLILSGNNNTVKAVLSGHTIYLQKIYIPPITTGGGGGGSNLYPDDCLLPSNLACANNDGIDYSDSYYDQTCCVSELTEHGAPTCELDPDEFYSEELFDAFNRAYSLNITTMCPFVDAKVPRKEIAKLISMFTIQIMGIFPDINKPGCDGYDDITYLSDEMKFFTKTACQLNLIGLEEDGYIPKQNFNPNDIITRAEFGTILSRLVYGDMYNVYEGEEETYEWYEKHLAALKRDNVMTKIQDPFIKEWRSWILLMLYRSYMSGLAETYRLVAPAHNGAISLLETVRK